MKKLLFFISILFLGSIIVSADEACNTYHKININIEGNGSLKVVDSDKTFTKDGTYNVKCNENFLFDVKADDGYTLNGVYTDGNHLSKGSYSYGIAGVSSNVNLKVIFVKDEETDDNEFVYKTFEDNISLYMADLKEELKKDSSLKFVLKEITIILDNNFIKNSNDNITIVANQVYRNDLNTKEQRAVRDSLYYDIILYNGENEVKDFKGNATIVIPYSKSKDVYVYRVLSNGKIKQVESTYKDGKVSFKVNEFGTFALNKEQLNELGYVKDVINLNNKQKIAIIMVGSALAALIVFVKIRKRK